MDIEMLKYQQNINDYKLPNGILYISQNENLFTDENYKSATVYARHLPKTDFSTNDVVNAIGLGIEMSSYSFDKYQTQKKANEYINKELEAYNPEIAHRPQVIAANKIDAIYGEENDFVAAIKAEFEPKGIKVYPISAVSGQGVRELLYYVNEMLEDINEEPTVFAQEYFPERLSGYMDMPFTVVYDAEEDEYVVEGPRIEKMLGYTNLESEKGFTFFQNFLKDSGILAELEKLGIEEGDTVRMYGLSFDYYK